MELIDIFLGIIAIGVSAGVGSITYEVLTRYFGHGYVSRREFFQYEDEILALKDRFQRFQGKTLTMAGREKKKEEEEILMANLPELIDRLPVADEIKDIGKKVPPALIMKMLKREGLL